jgi:phytoene synthase
VLYSQILDQIERKGYDVFSGRARVPAWRKAVTAARIMVTGPRSLKRQARPLVDVMIDNGGLPARSIADVTQNTY